MKLDLLVASGGVLSHAPRMSQTAMMLIDAFEPEGFTRLAKDSIFMMPHLGVLAQVCPEASLEVFERDCLVSLGTVVAPGGTAKPGRAFSYVLRSVSGETTGEVEIGDLARLPLGEGQTARLRVAPAKGLDCGAGPGREIEREVHGGTVGLVLDGRPRPLRIGPGDRARVARHVGAMNLYGAEET
jgi:hypothetical protein